MAFPLPARVSLSTGAAGLLLVVLNQLTTPEPDPPLVRASVLAALFAVGLMLVAVLWTRAVPEAAVRADLQGEEGLELVPGLPSSLVQDLGWGSQMLLTASPAAVVLVVWRGQVLLRRGLLAETRFSPGPICARAQERGHSLWHELRATRDAGTLSAAAAGGVAALERLVALRHAAPPVEPGQTRAGGVLRGLLTATGYQQHLGKVCAVFSVIGAEDHCRELVTVSSGGCHQVEAGTADEPCLHAICLRHLPEKRIAVGQLSLTHGERAL
jgi:hypothetical protein